ncbi:MAG: type VII toxin-antitoxin system HepT family RNase toxin [Candidatus Rokuibacteriota bacterium]
MIDRDRVLAKLDELDSYLGELRSVVPETFHEYLAVEKRRSSERLLQVAIEAVIDTCALLVTGLRLGLPADEDDLFEKLAARQVVSASTADLLRRMKGMRNILVHEYGRVDNELVFETAQQQLGDFDAFRREILAFLRRG